MGRGSAIIRVHSGDFPVIGSVWAGTSYGKLCEEAESAGYDLSNLYDGSTEKGYNNFSKVILAVAVYRGVKSYNEYLEMFKSIKPKDHTEDAIAEPVTKTMFARFSGIKSPDNTQTERTRRYRQRQRAELLRLRSQLNSKNSKK